LKCYPSSNQLSSRDGLPDLGPLSVKVPLETITAANKEVTKVLPSEDGKSGRGPYLTQVIESIPN